MTRLVTYTRRGPTHGIYSGVFDVHYENGVKLGELLAKEDGYYDFWPEALNGGCWSGEVLRDIAEALEKINAHWQFIIDNDKALNHT